MVFVITFWILLKYKNVFFFFLSIGLRKKLRIVMHVLNLIQTWEMERSGLFPSCVHKLETNIRKYYHINRVLLQIMFVLTMKIIQRNQVSFYPHDP